MLHAVTAWEALRERLSHLATSAGLPVPALEEDDARTPQSMARIRGRGVEERIVVSPSLVEADAAEQTWHLAACLGWWTSPVPRRRRRQAWALAGILFAAQATLGLADLVAAVDFPRWVFFAGTMLLGLLLLPLHAGLHRREQRALDAAGHEVLRSAGRDPAVLAQQVFGGQPDPPWVRRPLSSEPAPSSRIAAARGRPVEPYRPLF